VSERLRERLRSQEGALRSAIAALQRVKVVSGDTTSEEDKTRDVTAVTGTSIAAADHLRALRNTIAVDPEAFFVQADDDKSQHLSTTEWNKICKVFVEDVTDDTIRTLFYEMAHGSDSISHSRFFEVAEEYRTVRHFVEKSECIDVLVDSLISKVNKERERSMSRSKLTPTDVGQGEQATDSGTTGVLEVLSNLSEKDGQALAASMARPLCDRVAKIKRDLAARDKAPAESIAVRDTDSKFANLPEAAYGKREDFHRGLEVIGFPHSKASEEMLNEWTDSGSDEPFETWNSGKIVTTTRKEWYFVKAPFETEPGWQDLPPSAWKKKHDYSTRTPIRLEVFLHATCARRGDVLFGDYQPERAYEKEDPLWLHANEVSMVKVVLLRFVKSQLDGMSLGAAFKRGGHAFEDKEASPKADTLSSKADKIVEKLCEYLTKTDGANSESTFAGAVEALATVANQAEIESIIVYFHDKFRQEKLRDEDVIGTRLYTGPG
jgi:hypothetical protein